MSGFSRVQALLQSVEEMARLIAELDDLRIRVQQAEARALARRQTDSAVVDLMTSVRLRRDPPERLARGKFRSGRGSADSGHDAHR